MAVAAATPSRQLWQLSHRYGVDPRWVARDRAPVIVDLAEMICQVSGEMHEKQGRRDRSFCDLVGIWRGESIVREPIEGAFERRNRAIDAGGEVAATNVAQRELGVAIAHVSISGQLRAEKVLDVSRQMQRERS